MPEYKHQDNPDRPTEIHIQEEETLSDEETADLKGEKLGDEHWDILVDGDEDTYVYKPNGEMLSAYLPDYIGRDTCVEAFKALRPCAMKGGNRKGNRSTATGKDSKKEITKEDGSTSDTPAVPGEIAPMTNVAGYFDRYPRVPYCRQTAYNVNNPDKFERAIPFFKQCAEGFEEHVPERFERQQQVAKETVDDWVITGTPFTTVTVNLNWQTAVHTDSGDYEEGFGVMPVISAGDYDGAYFMQPKFKVAYDCKTGDLLMNDVHEWHGNGPFHSSDGYYERLSVVLYYRKEMAECGTPEEELERAKEQRDYADDPDDLSEVAEDEAQPNQRTTEADD